jgi:hypothetical protein
LPNIPGQELVHNFHLRKEIMRLLTRYGFEVREVRVEHIFPYRVQDYIRYRYVKEWYFRFSLPPAALAG